MKRQRFYVQLALVLSFVSLLPTLFIPAKASATYRNCASAALVYGRADGCGYFTNGAVPTSSQDNVFNDTIGSGIPAGTNSKPLVIKMISDRINSADGRARLVANAIVFTMLGCDPNVSCTFGGVNLGIASNGNVTTIPANPFWSAWTSAVNASSIVYHQNITYTCGVTNSLWDTTNNDMTFYTGGDRAVFEACGPAVVFDTMSFYDPTGTTLEYQIKWSCGNPIGTLNPLQPTNFTVGLATSSSPAQVALPARAKVAGGDTVAITATLTNSGPADSNPGDLQIEYPGASFASAPCPVACATPPAMQGPLTGGHSSGDGFRTATGIAGVPGQNWYWAVKSLGTGASGTTTGTVNFVVPAGAPVGSAFDINVWFQPTDLAAGEAHDVLHFIVVSARTPSLAAINGDIHAGNLCTQTAISGYVQAMIAPAGTSYGQYAVSATGSISGLTSNNGGNSLNLGFNGSYASICRPDLLTAANTARPTAAGVATIPVAASTQSLSTLSALPSPDVYFFDGPDLFISGTIFNKITIVAAGNVHIIGNIIINNVSHTRGTLPSLGVIAGGNIEIDPAVAQVDSYLFSDGVIDTCNPAFLTILCANSDLRINGFVMGKSLVFGRLGLLNTNGSAASETVVLNPEIYLNPPKFFDSSVDDILLQGQGERAPLF